MAWSGATLAGGLSARGHAAPAAQRRAPALAHEVLHRLRVRHGQRRAEELVRDAFVGAALHRDAGLLRPPGRNLAL